MHPKFAMNLNKFKKISSDKDHTIMQHDDGHSIKIAHKALSPKMRAEMAKIPIHQEAEKFANGGEAGKPAVDPHSPYIDPKKAKEVEKGATKSGWDPEQWKKNLKEGLGYAKGGKVEAEPILPAPKYVDAEPIAPHKAKHPVDYEAIAPRRMADGGVYGLPGEANSTPAEEPIPGLEPSPVATPMPSPELAPAEAPEPMPAAPSASAPMTMPSAAPMPSAPAAQMPSTLEGYNTQVAGINNEAKAIDDKAKEEGRAIATQLKAATDLQQNYQTHYDELDKERNAFQDDIINKHIDPNHYMGSLDTLGKFDTAIGLILGGIGGGGHTNLALDFLNKQIDRDVDAQKLELGKKENLLSANLRQFGNLHDAVSMTKLMQGDILMTKLKQAEAKASSPIAKANAQKQIGELQLKLGPEAQKLATKQALASAIKGGGDISKLNPANLVSQFVPKEHQEAVYKEVERAMNTRAATKEILDEYDKVVGDLKGVKNTTSALVKEPVSIQALRGKLITTVGDLTGTVRQAEIENVDHSYIPRKILDNEEDLAERRKSLVKYLDSKSAAPRFRDYTGIDLGDFDKTASPSKVEKQDSEAKIKAADRAMASELSPQQQSFLKWARANPENLKAKEVLKKLGIK